MLYFTLTCDVCSPSPIHIQVAMGGGGGVVPIFGEDLGFSVNLNLYV